MAGQKREYPFNDRDFSMMLEGAEVKGAKYPPRGGFKGAKKGVNFNLSLNHPDLKEGFYANLSFPEFRHLISSIRFLAKYPGTEKKVIQAGLTYFKGGQRNPQGTTFAVYRDDAGKIWIAVRSKKLPAACRFPLTPSTLMMTDNDGSELSPREAAVIGALGWADHWSDRCKEWVAEAIAQGAGQDNGGGYGGGNGGGNSGGYDGGGSDDDQSGDDDIPF